MEKEEVAKLTRKDFLKELPNVVRQMDAFRAGSNETRPTNIALGDYVNERYGLSLNDYYTKLGINPQMDTMQNLFSMPDQDIRWLVPEIIRDAIYLGIYQAPFYPNIIASDQAVNGLKVTMPFVNPSEAAPAKVNEAETIPLGNISFGQKSVGLYKIGKGFKLTDEVKNYVSLDVVSLFLRDFGYQLGYAMDSLAIDTVINGNIEDGSESAPVLGVGTPANGITYRDLLRIWVRAARLGRNFKTMIGDEEAAIDLLDLPEFKNRQSGTTMATLNLKTPVPNSADFFIHPGIPDDNVLLVDRSAALIKLTARQLMLESERIVSNQTEAIYATLTTGFAKMYRDAAILINGKEDIKTNNFPEYMNIDPYIQMEIGR